MGWNIIYRFGNYLFFLICKYGMIYIFYCFLKLVIMLLVRLGEMIYGYLL